jgi:alpha-tubulin suppressor-like RCC1 family protein
LTASSDVLAWGRNAQGQLGNGSTTGSSVPVAVDASGALEGKAVVWSDGGLDHTCAVTSSSDGLAYCWGANADGQLGNGSTDASDIPVQVDPTAWPEDALVTEVSVHGNHSCALTSEESDNLYCWGDNDFGQIGNDSTSDSSTPQQVGGLLAGKAVRKIAAGTDHTCALTTETSSNAYCWGANSNGQLGNGTTEDSLIPVAVSTESLPEGETLDQISSGAGFSCAVTLSGATYCWGDNTNNRLGVGTDANLSSVPVAVDASGVLSGKTVLQVSCGNDYACAVASDDPNASAGEVYCWGSDQYGQLGNGDATGSSPVPAPVIGLGSVAQLAAGHEHVCAVAATGSIHCWGRNSDGQLGNASQSDAQEPVEVVDANGVLSDKQIGRIAAGGFHSIATAQAIGISCPAETTVASQPDRGDWLSLLDDLRDGVLARSVSGQELIAIYYRHSDEVRAQLQKRPLLALRALRILRMLRSDLSDVTAGQRPWLQARKVVAVRGFARALKRGSSPALARDLDAFLRRDLNALVRQVTER